MYPMLSSLDIIISLYKKYAWNIMSYWECYNMTLVLFFLFLFLMLNEGCWALWSYKGVFSPFLFLVIIIPQLYLVSCWCGAPWVMVSGNRLPLPGANVRRQQCQLAPGTVNILFFPIHSFIWILCNVYYMTVPNKWTWTWTWTSCSLFYV